MRNEEMEAKPNISQHLGGAHTDALLLAPASGIASAVERKMPEALAEVGRNLSPQRGEFENFAAVRRLQKAERDCQGREALAKPFTIPLCVDRWRRR